MATIQIRDIPEDAYEILRRRAREAGQSLQRYMREHLIEFTSTPTKAEAVAAIESLLERYGGAGATVDQIVANLHADRR